ncbi:MAG TPA: hypothetical protein VM145_04815 [Sphingomicrobium sp.]|nr:hypothetical protein [Sphingomicrobium sp.]
MIEHGAVKRFRRDCEPTGGPAIGITGAWIAARVIVGEYDTGALVFDRLGHDLAQGEGRAGFIAGKAGNMKTARSVVDMGDPQAFAGWVAIRQASGKEFAGGLEAVELQREFGTLIPHCHACIASRTAARFQPDRKRRESLSILN